MRMFIAAELSGELLDARGIAYDGKPFIADATLAWRTDISAQDLAQLNEELRPVQGCVAAATLFRSDLSSAGAAYTPIRRIVLPTAGSVDCDAPAPRRASTNFGTATATRSEGDAR